MVDYLAFGSGIRTHLVVSTGHSFFDLDAKVLSLVNLAPTQDLSRTVGTYLNPIRFKVKVYFKALKAWLELNWVGRTIKLRSARLEVVKRIQRCSATNVNLVTAIRDQSLPKSLIDVMGMQTRFFC